MRKKRALPMFSILYLRYGQNSAREMPANICSVTVRFVISALWKPSINYGRKWNCVHKTHKYALWRERRTFECKAMWFIKYTVSALHVICINVYNCRLLVISWSVLIKPVSILVLTVLTYILAYWFVCVKVIEWLEIKHPWGYRWLCFLFNP